MPLPDKQTVLNWYASFCAQLKETYGLDLTKKTDLMRVGCLHTERLKEGRLYDSPFIPHTADGDVGSEPEPDYKEAVEALKLISRIKDDQYQSDEQRAEDKRRYAAHAEKMDEAHHAWEIRSQTLFDGSREQDYEQIARLYEDAHEGRMFLYDKTGDISNAHFLYVGDDNELCSGRSMDGNDPMFTCIPDVRKPLSATDVFRYVCSGAKPKTDQAIEKGSPADRARAVNAYVKQRHPEMDSLTPKDFSLCTDYINGDLQGREPARVEKPGFMSRLKWVFSLFRNTEDYDKYNAYVREKAAWDADMATAKAAYGQFVKVESDLVADAGLMPEIKDPARRERVHHTQVQMDQIKSYARMMEAKDTVTVIKSEIGDKAAEKLQADSMSMMSTARTAFFEEIAAHPEHFDRSGSRTAAGRTALANKSMNAQQKADAVKGLGEQLAEAKESAMDRIRARLAEANTSGGMTSDKDFAADVATLIQARSLEGQLAKYKKGDDLFRGFDMKKQGIEESGIYLASHASFMQAFGTKDDLREIAFDLAQSGRSPEALNDRLDSLLKRYNDARKPVNSAKQTEVKTAVKAQPVQEKKNEEPEDKWIMREPKSPF